VSWFADKIIKWRSCKPELYLEMFSWINYGKIRFIVQQKSTAQYWYIFQSLSVCLSLSVSFFLSVCLPAYLPAYISVCW
jgi:hypothetical protein